jgi:sirohydrochlorin cobaltochelatase
MLILIVHGSRNPEWRGSVERVTELLQAELGQQQVRLAYMEYTPPTLADVVADAVQAGVKKIRVLPLFLSAAGHVERNIRPLVEDIQKTLAPGQMELLPPMGQHRLFRKLLYEIAVEPNE